MADDEIETMDELSDINRVGEKVEERLRENDINDPYDLVDMDVDTLMEVTGASDWAAGKMKEHVRENTISYDMGDEILEEYRNRDRVPTGLGHLDELYNGGLGRQMFHGVAGQPGTGKTQIAFKSLVSAIEAKEQPALYIDTEGDRYAPVRMGKISEWGEDINSHVIRPKIKSLEDQYATYGSMMNQLSRREGIEELSLIVIDSFNGPMRHSGRFQDRSDYSERGELLRKHMNQIENMAEEFNAPVLMTLQIYSSPDAFAGDRASNEGTIWGSDQFEHWLYSVVGLRGGSGERNTTATVRNHPEIGAEKFDIVVTDDEIYTVDN